MPVRALEQAVEEHVSALSSGDVRRAYAAYPRGEQPDFASFRRDYESSRPRYERVRVVQARMATADTAEVRVTFVYHDAQVGTVTVDPPGQWWRVVKDLGVWRVGWLAAQ